jgi:hypothetical protein
MDIHRNVSRDIVFGPTYMGGHTLRMDMHRSNPTRGWHIRAVYFSQLFGLWIGSPNQHMGERDLVVPRDR